MVRLRCKDGQAIRNDVRRELRRAGRWKRWLVKKMWRSTDYLLHRVSRETGAGMRERSAEVRAAAV